MVLTRKQRKYRQNLLRSFGCTRAQTKKARTHQDFVDLYDELIEREIDKNSGRFQDDIMKAVLGLPTSNAGKAPPLDIRKVNSWVRWANLTESANLGLSFNNGGFNGG